MLTESTDRQAVLSEGKLLNPYVSLNGRQKAEKPFADSVQTNQIYPQSIQELDCRHFGDFDGWGTSLWPKGNPEGLPYSEQTYHHFANEKRT